MRRYIILLALLMSGCGRYAVRDDLMTVYKNQRAIYKQQQNIIKVLIDKGVVEESNKGD